jgi:hypothetical protein
MSVSVLANKFFQDRIAFLVLCAATCAYLYLRFERIFKCPACYLFSDGGDGLKNYFTSAYYVRHSKGLWFTGMNYPYGEHPVYTDNQPAWSLLMKLVNTVVPMDMHVTGILNMLMILSLGVAVLVVYLLLRELRLPAWYAALVSLPIVFLSPQIARFNGHYSLAYVCYLPVFLWLFVRWVRMGGGTWKGGVGLLIWIVWTGFTHLYYFFIETAFILAWIVVHLAFQKFRWSAVHSRILLLAVLAGISVYLPVKLTDPVKDRPREAYGMYVFAATPAGTFLPWHGAWERIWKEDYGIKAPDTESRVYIGIAALLIIPLILISAMTGAFRRWRDRDPDTVAEITPGMIAWSGLLVWIMATGWFYMAGGAILIEAFPVLGQFRSLGRLAWMFYFTVNCYAAWFVFYKIRSVRSRIGRYILIALATLLYSVWILEAHEYTRVMTYEIYRHNHIFRGDKPFLDLLQSNGNDPGDFQAILQLPLTIIGTENLPVHRGHWELNKTMQCAWETGLPIVNYNMSRTSVSHALSLLQLLSTPDIDKVRLDDMNTKPLLLVTSRETHLPAEQRLIALADSIGHAATLDLYRLDLSAFSATAAIPPVQWDTIVTENFEHLPSPHAFQGSGAYRSVSNQVYFSYTDTVSAGVPLHFACWVYIGAEIRGFPATRVVWYDTEEALRNEQVHSIHSFDPWQVRENWVEVTFPLENRIPGAQYDFSILTDGAVIDAVLIRAERPPARAGNAD